MSRFTAAVMGVFLLGRFGTDFGIARAKGEEERGVEDAAGDKTRLRLIRFCGMLSLRRTGTVEAFFDAVRRNDVGEVRRLLEANPGLAKARWPGRGRPDGMMRSLGPAPYNQHSWLPAP